jgi:hypothetical protein
MFFRHPVCEFGLMNGMLLSTTRSLALGLSSCYLGELITRSNERFTGTISQQRIDKIKRSVEALNIEEHRRLRPPTYDVHQFLKNGAAVKGCNMSVVNEWNRTPHDIGSDEHLILTKALNHKHKWTCHARKALRMAARAFRLVDIPLIPSDGTALGWYRGLMMWSLNVGVFMHRWDR